MGEVASQNEHVAPSGLRPKRLVGLWIICVLFGSNGFSAVAMALRAKPLGIAVFGAMALVSFALALGLWVRSRVAWFAACALIVLAFLCPVADVLRKDSTQHNAVEELILDGILFGYLLFLGGYLWFRRRYFKVPAPQKPRLLSVSAAVAGAVVILPGIARTLLYTIDDAPKAFPRLELKAESVPDEQNAFLVLQETMKRFPESGRDEVYELIYPSADKGTPAGTAEWKAKAREALDKYRGCLDGAERMLILPRFQPPVPTSYRDWYDRNEFEWLNYLGALGCLLALRSELEALDGKYAEALRDAGKLQGIGKLLLEQNDGLVAYHWARDNTVLALRVLRRSASEGGATKALLAPVIGQVPGDADLKQSLVRAAAFDFAGDQLCLRAWRDDPRLSPVGELGIRKMYSGLLRHREPFLKLNITRNALGECYQGMLDRADRYRPPAPEAGTPRYGGNWQQPGSFRFLRNGLGEIFLLETEPNVDRDVLEYFRLKAEARLTRVFLGLRCYQLENGRLPATLDELMPKYLAEVPVDPFTERPFVYEPDAAPPRLRSVGPDQKPDAPDAREKDDIVLELDFPVPAN